MPRDARHGFKQGILDGKQIIDSRRGYFEKPRLETALDGQSFAAKTLTAMREFNLDERLQPAAKNKKPRT